MLFTVPSRYWFPIGRRRYLALGRGPPSFPPDFACPAVLTSVTTRPCTLSPTGLSPSPVARSSGVRLDGTRAREAVCRPAPRHRSTPGRQRRQARTPARFGLLPVRSPLLRESSLFLGVLRCFSSPGAPHAYAQPGARPYTGRVAPFGHPRIAGCQRLPGAFAAWPRPSSAADA